MKHLGILTFLALGIGLFTACVDQEFDVPPTQGPSDLEANATIADIKQLHRNNVTVEITEDLIISGQVVSDDTEGNFYKEMALQDETGGILIRLNQTNLQTVYQRDREVFVKCKGLSIGDYGGTIQLGLGGSGGNVDQIPELLIPDYVEKGDIGTPAVPTEVLISNLSSANVGTLVKLSEVEFSRDDFEQPFADEDNAQGAGTNRQLEDCIGGSIIFRTSIYADFADELTPFFNGEAVGVITVFNDDYQFLVRDPDDLDMSAPPCNRSATAPEQIALSDLRSTYEGGGRSIEDAKKIVGVVLSDVDAGNMTNRNLALQDETGGIIVRFTSSHSFQPEDVLEIDVSSLAMEEYQGLLQISDVPIGRAKILSGSSLSITPNEVTISELLNDFENLESTLVQIKNAEFPNGGSFSGSVEVVDASGSMTMYTRSQADFASESLPSGMVDIVAIVTQGGTSEVQQISLRTRGDVTGGNTGGGNADTLDMLFEDFSTLSDNEQVVLEGWTNVAEKGERTWLAKEFSGNVYAQATAYNDSSPQMETWLVTPPLNMDIITTLGFESAMAFYTHEGLTVWYSADFDGNDVSSANWEQLSCRIATESDGDHAWVPSGTVDLSSYNGIGYIAFRHIGDNSSGTTSYRVDNIDIK